MQEPQNPQDWIYTFFSSGRGCWDMVKDECNDNCDDFIWKYVDRCIELHKLDTELED